MYDNVRIRIDMLGSPDEIFCFTYGLGKMSKLTMALLRNTLHRGIIHCIFLSTKQQSHTDNTSVQGITEVLQPFFLLRTKANSLHFK